MDLIGRLRIAPQFILLAILIPGVIHWYLRESSHASLKIGDVMGGIVNRCTLEMRGIVAHRNGKEAIVRYEAVINVGMHGRHLW